MYLPENKQISLLAKAGGSVTSKWFLLDGIKHSLDFGQSAINDVSNRVQRH